MMSVSPVLIITPWEKLEFSIEDNAAKLQ